MSEHGFLRPNPALLDLENRIKRKPKLAHELGEGARCTQCGDKCSGFQLHYWRKVCLNCRCGKAEHNVIDAQDPGFYFVGKIFDRPLRSREEELEFCYGDSSEEENDSVHGGSRNKRGEGGGGKTVKFDWVPPNISKALARRYLEQLPAGSVPIAGSEGAQLRKQQLERQFPMHDIEPKECHELTPGEVESMQEYINAVKEHVVGQAEVSELPPPPPSSLAPSLGGPSDPDFPPPPSEEELLSGLSLKPSTGPATLPKPGSSSSSGSVSSPTKLFHAKPYQPHLGSLGSSRNNSPSPTSSTEDPSEAASSPFGLKRPGQFVRKNGIPHNVVGTCGGCNGQLHAGDVAVKADRAGPGKMWHPQCFKCQTCNELLVDLLYYYESGHVYCARDYATKAKIPRCGACDELIFAPEYTGAEDKVWHLKHFCCFECDRALAGHKYIAVKGQPHCLMCYQAKEGKVCTTCGEYLNPEEQRVSLGSNHWHSRDACFRCGVCHTSLLGRKMTRKHGHILCSSACAKKADQDKLAHEQKQQVNEEQRYLQPAQVSGKPTLV